MAYNDSDRVPLWRSRQLRRGRIFVCLLLYVLAFMVFVLYRRDGDNVRLAHPKTSIAASVTSSAADFYKDLSPNRPVSSPDNTDSLAVDKERESDRAGSPPNKNASLDVDKERGPNRVGSSPDKSDPPSVDKERGPSQAGSSPNKNISLEVGKERGPSSTPNKNASLDVVLDPTRVAMIIEMRHIPHLPALLVYFIGTLPPAWIVQLVGNEVAFAPVKKSSALSGAIQSGKLVLRALPPYYEVATQELLSITLTNLTFYSEFVQPAEWLLMFQTDSIICAASNQSIDDWVEKGYDWAGAPWSLSSKGGNGGLSLRHVPPIVELLKDPSNVRPPHADMAFEDLWLSSRLENLPSPFEMSTFSVESVYYEQPLGYHLRGSGILIDSLIWSNETRKHQIFDYCPEIKLVLPQLDFK